MSHAIVIESTGVWEYIYDLLEQMCYEVKLANPIKTRMIAEACVKTDKIDAAKLANLLRTNFVAESYIPPKHVRRLREIVRERRTFVQQTTQIKNRIHALLVKRGIALPSVTLCKSTRLWLREQKDESGMFKHYLNLLDYHEQELHAIEAQIRKLADENSDAQILMTIPGIGALRAMDLLAEIGEISRFPTTEKLCSYAGLVPSVHQSGNTLHFGRLIRQSSKSIKHVLVETSWTLTRTRKNNRLQRVYRKLAKKRGKQKAICATARKLCTIVHAMLSKKREFIVL